MIQYSNKDREMNLPVLVFRNIAARLSIQRNGQVCLVAIGRITIYANAVTEEGETESPIICGNDTEASIQPNSEISVTMQLTIACSTRSSHKDTQ